MTFIKKLETRMDKVNSLLCVGLDPDLEKIPSQFLTNKDPIFEFNKWIISQTHEYVCAYKPNSAFYESYGSKGIESLKKTCDYIYENHPDIPVIIDAKRGDIGHTNAKYAQYVFEYLGADAVTLQPYLGSEALEEFFKYKNKGLIILCRTSNQGAGEFQDLLVDDDSKPLWQKIAKEISSTWVKKSKADLLLVIGATYPLELKKVRELCPDMTFLVPGVGSQGGSLEKTLLFGCNKNKKGIIINSSRGIIYSHNPRQSMIELWKSSQKHT
jgi:orotidine-5'-phosphate decarboxylase